MGRRAKKGYRQQSIDRSSAERKLLKYAATGEARKVKKYLKRHGSDIISAHDVAGNTGLHEVVDVLGLLDNLPTCPCCCW